MKFKLYNTLSKKVEELITHDKGVVNIYTCGPTVYNYAHIGNLRTYIFEDVLVKTLDLIGYKVNRVMNITDVGHMESEADEGEDKMLKGAKRENKTVYEIAEYYTKAFFDDLEKLNIKTPDIISKASDNIDIYIKIIQDLIDKEFAYISNGNVYFDITKSKNYYELSGKNSEDLKVAVRDDVNVDEFKKNPYDFGLWLTVSKFQNQIMKWDSPFGVGYPGWHIECSGISIKYLGEYLDIHCGGIDNIFPHHTNEIAQSEAYLGHKWCSYWMHGEHLNDKFGKMSKSNGEFMKLSVINDMGYDAVHYRMFVLLSHYRKQLVFSDIALEQAKNTLDSMKKKILNLKEGNEIDDDIYNKYIDLFKKELSNDLNTANAVTVLQDLLKDDEINDSTKLKIISTMDTVLSLDLTKKNEQKINVDQNILDMIEKRNEAKNNKDYKKADEIREELKQLGINISDTANGTIII